MSPSTFDDGGDAVIEMDVLPPRWVDVQEQVTELLRDITTKSSQLDKLHQKHVLPGFDDEAVKREEEATIERMTQGITKSFHECQRAIQRIDTMMNESRQQGGLAKGDETMARNIQISLASKVQDVSASFRKKQSSYLRSEFSPQEISRLWTLTQLRAPAAGWHVVANRSLIHTNTKPLY